LNKKRQKIVVGSLKAAAGIGIVAWILVRLDEQDIWDQLRSAMANWPWVLAGFSGFIVCLIAISLRWQALLVAQGVRLQLRRVISLSFIGHFFNALMLGGTGGDIAKAYYVSREVGGQRTEAIATILVDRITGLITMIMIADVMMLAQTRLFMATPVLRQVYWWTLAISATAYLALIAAFSQNLLEKVPLFRRILGKMQRVGEIIHRVYDAFYLYRDHPGALLASLAYSTINQGVLVMMTVAFGYSLGVSLDLAVYYAIIPIANILGAMPLTPGGIGIREGAYVLLLPEFAVSDGHALVMSLLLTTSMTLWSLIGGAVFVLYTSGSGHKLSEELDQLQHTEDETADTDAQESPGGPADRQ